MNWRLFFNNCTSANFLTEACKLVQAIRPNDSHDPLWPAQITSSMGLLGFAFECTRWHPGNHERYTICIAPTTRMSLSIKIWMICDHPDTLTRSVPGRACAAKLGHLATLIERASWPPFHLMFCLSTRGLVSVLYPPHQQQQQQQQHCLCKIDFPGSLALAMYFNKMSCPSPASPVIGLRP